jgi:hypothetical protein
MDKNYVKNYIIDSINEFGNRHRNSEYLKCVTLLLKIIIFLIIIIMAYNFYYGSKKPEIMNDIKVPILQNFM